MPVDWVYVLRCIPYPFSEDRRRAGESAWCIVKEFRDGTLVLSSEPVAIFNLDSEAQNFASYVERKGQIEGRKR